MKASKKSLPLWLGLFVATTGLVLALAYLLDHSDPKPEPEPTQPSPHQSTTQRPQVPFKRPLKRPQKPPPTGPVRKGSVTPVKNPKKVTARDVTGVYGEVRDKDSGQPLAGATVWVEGIFKKVQSDQRGRFFVPAPEGQQVVVVATKPRFRHHGQRVPTTVGATKLQIFELKASKVGRIEGEVEFVGDPPETYTIFLNLQKHSFPGSKKRFEFEDVNVGSYFVGLSGTGSAASIPLVKKSVLVSEGETARVTLKLKRQIPVEIILRTPQGDPLPGATITLGGVSLRTNDQGRLKTDLIVEGEHFVLVYHPLFGHCDAGRALVNTPEQVLELQVRPKGNAGVTGLVTVNGQVPKWALIRFERASSKPANARLKAISARPISSRNTYRCQKDGRYVIPHRAPGRYRLSVLAESLKAERIVELKGSELITEDFKLSR